MALSEHWKPNCCTDGRVLAAANCLSVGQTYLYDNPLLTRSPAG